MWGWWVYFFAVGFYFWHLKRRQNAWHEDYSSNPRAFDDEDSGPPSIGGDLVGLGLLMVAMFIAIVVVLGLMRVWEIVQTHVLIVIK